MKGRGAPGVAGARLEPRAEPRSPQFGCSPRLMGSPSSPWSGPGGVADGVAGVAAPPPCLEWWWSSAPGTPSHPVPPRARLSPWPPPPTYGEASGASFITPDEPSHGRCLDNPSAARHTCPPPPTLAPHPLNWQNLSGRSIPPQRQRGRVAVTRWDELRRRARPRPASLAG